MQDREIEASGSMRRHVFGAAALMALLVLLVTGVDAHGQAQPLPWPQNPDWQRYVEAPSSSMLTPVAVVGTSGDVTNAAALTFSGNGQGATMTMAPGGVAPVIELDYGQEIAGFASFAVTSVSGAPVLRDAYSEQLANLSNTGDGAEVFLGSASPTRYEDRPIPSAGTYTDSVLQGGQRYQLLTLTEPGTVTIESDTTAFSAVYGTPTNIRGHFISNDDLLNRIWYAGVYTLNLTQVPPDTIPYPGVSSGAQSLLIDGAKRDRGVWSGDITIAGKTLLQALDPAYLRDSLCLYAEHPSATATAFTPADAPPLVAGCKAISSATSSTVGEVMPGECFPLSTPTNCVAYSGSYSLVYVPELFDYYSYTGDLDFVTQMWPAVVADLTWAAQQVDSTGLLVEPPGASLNWNIELTSGEQAWDNALYYLALVDASSLAAAQSLTTASSAYRASAGALQTAFNARLWNPQLQAYSDVPGDSALLQDGNVTAVAAGLADPGRAATIMDTLTTQLASPYGDLSVVPANASLRSQTISPFMNSWQVLADLSVHHTRDALTLIRQEWGHMISHDPGGVTWEKSNVDGSLGTTTSAAHGWGTGPTAGLSEYVLGVQPSAPAFGAFTVTPQTGDLSWVEGSVPTPGGEVDVEWGASGAIDDPTGFAIHVSAPTADTGTVAVPLYGAPRIITEDGQEVWNGAAATNGAQATTDGAYVYFAGATGSHLWEWGTVESPPTVPDLPGVPALLGVLAVCGLGVRVVQRSKRSHEEGRS